MMFCCFRNARRLQETTRGIWIASMGHYAKRRAGGSRGETSQERGRWTENAAQRHGRMWLRYKSRPRGVRTPWLFELNRKLENITEYDPISGIGINYFSAIQKCKSVCVSGNIWIASGSGWKTIAFLPAPVAVTRFPVGYGTAVTSGQITASGELQINLKGGTNTAYEFSVSYFSK